MLAVDDAAMVPVTKLPGATAVRMILPVNEDVNVMVASPAGVITTLSGMTSVILPDVIVLSQQRTSILKFDKLCVVAVMVTDVTEAAV